ncbi:MAG TPA: hypothetical protein VMG32_03010 [Anaeromyxobacteraceae bacterium]|nr:hypothetical protein [Anaeromyxobacteraceae bacterium]
MKAKNDKKPLHTESLKTLTDDDLGAVVGGLQFVLTQVLVTARSWSGSGEELPKES